MRETTPEREKPTEKDSPEPDWRFEWELAGRTRGANGGDAVLKHKSVEGRYRIIPEEDW